MYIKVNDVTLSYTKHGSGKPLIMLHGNGQDQEIFKESIPILKEHYTVYLIDLRGHGSSSKEAELHYLDYVSDIRSVINQLNIVKPIFYGFSDGGIVGLMLASQYPDLLSKLIVSSPNLNPQGLSFLSRCFMKFIYNITKSSKIKLILEEPNISVEELGNIKIPTYITGGYFDMITLRHLRKINKSIHNSVLKIFKYHSHGSYINHSEIIAKYILTLDK